MRKKLQAATDAELRTHLRHSNMGIGNVIAALEMGILDEHQGEYGAGIGHAINRHQASVEEARRRLGYRVGA
jgi:hypothetical protein